jgi:antitoxin component of MazEF toxin-antitoxin module
MTNQRVMTLEDPAGLLITTELLEQIGVSKGDKIEISVSEGTLIVRSLTVAETERRNAATLKGAEAVDDESTITFRELIYKELRALGVSSVAGFEVTLADGRKLLFLHADDPQLDEIVKLADIREVKPLISGKAYGPAVDDSMESIMDRYDNLFRRLAEGAK